MPRQYSSSSRGSGASGAMRAISLLAAFLATSMVAGVLAAGLLIPAVGATGSLASDSVDFFDSLPVELESQPLSEQSVMLAADGSKLATFYAENRILAPLSAVSPLMRQAIIAIEDSRFYDHNGIDTRGTGRAFVNNLTGGDTQGASTLTQQYVKNVLLDSAVRAGDEEAQQAVVAESYGRKLREAKLAISVEKNLTKDEILEGYLNISNFGDGSFGIQSASRHYFNKDAKDLALAESALLAGLVRSPTYYNPASNPERAIARRDLVLGRMLDLDMITQARHDEAVAIPLEAMLDVQANRNGCVSSQAPFFCDYVYNILVQDPVFGETAEERAQLIRRGGLTIRTTLDPALNNVAQEKVSEAIPNDDPSGVAATAVTLGEGGHILAMAQNRTFAPGADAVPGGTAINYNVDARYNGTRGVQPGSTFKPITLATWLASGRSLNDKIPAPGQTETPFSDFVSCERLNPNTIYEHGNNEGAGQGEATVLEATYRSINTSFVAMLEEIDICNVRDTAHNLGVNLAYPNGAGNTDLAALPSITLGTPTVSPLTMAEAYATFAAGGLHCTPVAITSVQGRDGAELPIPASDCQQVIEPEIADGVTYALTQVMEKGTGRAHQLERPTAGKTGTAQGYSATWFIGYTPQLTTAVWVGDPGGAGEEPVALDKLSIAGEPPRRIFGSTIALPLWKSIMEPALADLPVVEFPEPSDEVLFGERLRVPDVRGMTRDEAVEALEDAGLNPSVAGSRQFSNRVDRGLVSGTSPGVGSQPRRGSSITVFISAGPRPAAPPPRAPDPAPAPAPEPTEEPTTAPPPTSAPAPQPPVEPAPPGDDEAAPPAQPDPPREGADPPRNPDPPGDAAAPPDDDAAPGRDRGGRGDHPRIPRRPGD